MTSEEIFHTLALTRLTGFNAAMALQLYQTLGSASAVYEHRHDIGDIVSDCSPRLVEAIKDWDDAQKRAAAEMAFITKHSIQALTFNSDDYPERLRHCPDAPLVLFYKGNVALNRQHVIDIVGTRHCTSYGQDLIHRFVSRLHELCPDVLIVSGLAYGVDICAHREALAVGYDTVGVLAHGLDTIYPARHRQTAAEMVSRGGLLTEYMTQTEPLPNNFRQRNRIVAGISDATILVESAIKGGGLITCRIAQEYGRDVFAFPGAVGMPYSEGCNHIIRNNTAALITSADDFIESMGWQTMKDMPLWLTPPPRSAGDAQIPDLSPQEQTVVTELRQTNDLQLNILSVRTNIPIGELTALLFSLELKGVIRPLAGGTYHLIT